MSPIPDYGKDSNIQSKRWIAVGAVIFLLVGGWLVYDWLQTRHQQMSDQPGRSSSSVGFEARASTVVASIGVPYTVIQNTANSQKGQITGSKADHQDIKCISNDFPRFRECLTVNWHVNYSPNGDISIAKSDEFVRITLPAKFDGGAGFGGDLAGRLSLNDKTFNGSFILTADATVKLDDRFCPKLVPGSVTFNWTSAPSVEIIGRNEFRILGIGFDVGPWPLDLSSIITDPIRTQLNSVVLSAGNAIPCDPVRAELAKVWRRYSVPLNVSPPVYLLAEPTEMSAALFAGDDSLKLNAMLKAKVEIATTPGNEDGLGDLPLHIPMAMQPGLLSVALPLQVDYAVVQSEVMTRFAGKSFEFEGPGGKSTVILNSLELYPSGDKLAIGVTFTADLPSRFFDSSGTVWLSGEPVVDPSGKVLRLKDATITRQLDNGLWNILTAALQDTINSEIQNNLHYDLSADETKAVQNIQAAVADPLKTGGIKFTVTETSINFGRVQVGEKAFFIEGLLDAKWDATLGVIQL